MPRLHALELVADAAGEAPVRAEWQALRDHGLPSMLDHPGATNTPHLTVIALPTVSDADEARAVDLLGPLLPVRVVTSGVAVFGGDRVTLVRTVDLADEVTRAVLDLRAATSGHQHPGWLPHLTLARRLPRADLARAVEAVGHTSIEVSLTALRRWDPDLGTVRTLAQSSPSPT
ncbi:MAG: 2'-5' RNA ligase family protein [Nocardioidaceae bacterium]